MFQPQCADYTLAGYQVLKKWLSYRERDLLKRPLSPDEVQYFSLMVRRIAAVLLLGPHLDASYAAVKEGHVPWQGPESLHNFAATQGVPPLV